MNDSEIIKALTTSSDPNNLNCQPTTKLCKEALDLIKRQQAEIDRLNIDLKAMRGAANGFKAEVERLTQENNALNGNTEKYIKECENRSRQIAESCREEIKFEAVREFAERLKNFAMTERVCVEQGRYVNISYVNVCDIERIAEEMVHRNEKVE